MSDTPRSVTPLGARLAWMRDFALIGAVSGSAAPALFWLQAPGYLVACGVAGAALGLALGLLLPPLLLGPVSRWPFAVLLVVGLAVGAAWGGGTGLAGGLFAFGAQDRMGLAWLSGACGAVAGAMQLGWFWLPYTLRKAKSRSTWPIVLAACLLSGGLGFAALSVLSLG